MRAPCIQRLRRARNDARGTVASVSAQGQQTIPQGSGLPRPGKRRAALPSSEARMTQVAWRKTQWTQGQGTHLPQEGSGEGLVHHEQPTRNRDRQGRHGEAPEGRVGCHGAAQAT